MILLGQRSGPRILSIVILFIFVFVFARARCAPMGHDGLCRAQDGKAVPASAILGRAAGCAVRQLVAHVLWHEEGAIVAGVVFGIGADAVSEGLSIAGRGAKVRVVGAARRSRARGW